MFVYLLACHCNQTEALLMKDGGSVIREWFMETERRDVHRISLSKWSLFGAHMDEDGSVLVNQ